MNREWEPYRSYLAEEAAGNSPAPFIIGLAVKGGTYDGRQLILTWPDTYEPPLALPKLDGSGGNEANAGSGNNNDSTPEGQRPNLPQNPQDNHNIKESPVNPPQNHVSMPPVSSSADTPPTADPTWETTPTKGNQRQKQNHTYRNPASYLLHYFTAQPLTEIFPAETKAADKKDNSHTEVTADKKDNSRTEVTADVINDAPAETAVKNPQPAASSPAPTGQDKNLNADEISGLPEMPGYSVPGKKHGSFPPLAIAAAAIIIAVAVRKIMAGRKSGRVLNFLQKLHHKCRTFPRR